MLTVRDITCRMGGRVLLNQANLTVMDKWHVGLIGLNGTGKSTLFKLITGEMESDGGSIEISARARMGIVRQDMPESDLPLIDIVLAADEERTQLLIESEDCHDPHRVAEIYDRLNEIDAYTAPARASTILAGLGFSEDQINGPFSALSGGWRMRVALASVLFLQPDLLLLDEPTNHLDLEAIIWLEGYLANYPHTILMISHDRDLLNKCVDHVVHLYDQKLTLYNGNYDTFERTRAERLELQQKIFEKQQTVKNHMQAFIDRFRAKASKARQAQSRIKMLEKMDWVEEVIADRSVRFQFPQPEKHAARLITFDYVDVGYGENKPVLRNINMIIDRDDRIALLGANGNGKSTLIKLIAGKLQPQKGEKITAQKLRIGYFSQHQADELDLNETPYEVMHRLCAKNKVDSRESVVRARLGRFGFSKELSDNKISSLSGGEKSRLLFAVMSFDAPHILLLDEPTNHLDIEARSALVDALNAYEGAVVIVSHDPTMLERVADRLWLVHDGKVEDFDGDLTDYRRFVLDQKKNRRKAQKQSKENKDAAKRAADAALNATDSQLENTERDNKTSPSLSLLKKIEQAEKELARLTEEVKKFEAMMLAPDFYKDANRAQTVQQLYHGMSQKLKTQEEMWIKLCQECEND